MIRSATTTCLRKTVASSPLNKNKLTFLQQSCATFSTSTCSKRNLLSLADLSTTEITKLIDSSAKFKNAHKTNVVKREDGSEKIPTYDSLEGKTVSLMFSKRSTRTRISSETSLKLLGAHPMFLGSSDIQLGVNESLYDSAVVIGSMVDGIFARVGDHSEVETLAKHANVPVINALSSLYHPMQILADLLTLQETYFGRNNVSSTSSLEMLRGLNVTWIGDANNILNDMIVAYPRLGINLNIAIPAGDKYALDKRVLVTYEDGISQMQQHDKGSLQVFHKPEDALKNADVVVTDTWVSMGQEAEKEQRLRDFAGYQVTENLAKKGNAKSDWKFLHCLPRKAEEVDDKVFYGPRSLVFPEAENRKWTAIAAFDALYSGKNIQ